MISLPPTPTTDYAAQAAEQARQRDVLTRNIRLLRRVRDAVAAGDPAPSLGEVLRVTGLPHPGVDSPAAAFDALLTTAEDERRALNRRLRLTRELGSAAAAPAPPLAPSAPPAPAAVSPLAEEAARLARVSSRDLDRLPYGAIVLDATGRVVAYNDTESRMARLPVEAVLGRNFFTEVAPCTRVQAFEGRFRTLAAGDGPQVVTFDFTFPFPFGTQRVAVMITRGATPGTVIMALLRRETAA